MYLKGNLIQETMFSPGGGGMGLDRAGGEFERSGIEFFVPWRQKPIHSFDPISRLVCCSFFGSKWVNIKKIQSFARIASTEGTYIIRRHKQYRYKTVHVLYITKRYIATKRYVTKPYSIIIDWLGVKPKLTEPWMWSVTIPTHGLVGHFV